MPIDNRKIRELQRRLKQKKKNILTNNINPPLNKNIKGVIKKITETKDTSVYFSCLEEIYNHLFSLITYNKKLIDLTFLRDIDIPIENTYFNGEVTFLIKTFERPGCLLTLLNSINKYYPGIDIVIVDDSKNPIKIHQPNIKYIELPFNSGLSKGRNIGIKNVDTKYVVVLDDDFEFTKQTKIDILYDYIKNTDLDIVGGKVWSLNKKNFHEFCGNIDICNNIITHTKKLHKKEKNLHYCDVILNFFIAKTDDLLKYTWDDDLKIVGEHLDFFLTIKDKLKVGYTPNVIINNGNKGNYLNNTFYNSFRLKNTDVYIHKLLKKWNKNKLISYYGKEFSI